MSRRPSIVDRRLASLALSTTLMLSCGPEKSAGPAEPIGNRRPTARIVMTPSGPILEGMVVVYDARSSTDPDGDSLTYLWNFGYGTARTWPSAISSFTDEGSYEAIVIVTDPHGAADTAIMETEVGNAAPSVFNLVTPSGAILVETLPEIRFEVQDAGIDDTVMVQVDWKDGTTSTPKLRLHSYDHGFDVTAAHRYSTPGQYAVEITARDNDSGVTKLVVDHPISVVGPHENHPPVAHITGPATGSEGEWRAFSGASSTDPDGDSLRITCVSDDGLKP